MGEFLDPIVSSGEVQLCFERGSKYDKAWHHYHAHGANWQDATTIQRVVARGDSFGSGSLDLSGRIAARWRHV